MFNRDMLADTFAMVTFSIIIGMTVELMAGLTFDQSLQSRLLSIPVNLFTARAYGLYRDWLFRRGSKIGQGFMQMALLDALAYVSFQIPLYASLVISTGAGVEQVLMACAGQIGAMLIMGRPYGIYMQYCRLWFKPVAIPAA
ncbi:L-alanine exporter AlaE [uncultured Endozoicomonas sp.]|uniref:L-alanine exporter AlaE n=1 Tax=uncultured Endozoicomonas sp. TaxID=432652 RepID=UPI002618C2E6|nr:L-alanine exporter AlaE [uncultured Endozoicomonas sp.]